MLVYLLVRDIVRRSLARGRPAPPRKDAGEDTDERRRGTEPKEAEAAS